MTPTLARIENVALNEGFADNDNCEDAAILSGLVADNLYDAGGGGVGFTVSNFDDCDIYGNVRAVHDLTVCGIATLEDTTAKGPATWNAGLQGFEVRDALTSFRGATFNARLLLDIATGQEAAEVLVSADDTTDVLTYLTAPVAIVTGTGVLYWVQLPDATTCQVGCRREVVNASPEFVGVKNSSSATWHRVPPRAKCVCYLLDNSTAAGVWFSEVIESHDPIDGFSKFSEMFSVAESLPLTLVTSGTGSSAATASTGNFQGNRYIAAAAVNDVALLYVFSASTIVLGTSSRAVLARTKLPTLSTVAEEYIARVGFGDNIVGGAHANGVYFLYDRATHGDFWVLRNIDAGGNETVVTAVAPSSSYKKLRIEVASDSSRSDFWIDNTQLSPAGGLTTHIPGVSLYQYVQSMTKTVGGTVRYCDVEFVKIQSLPTTRR